MAKAASPAVFPPTHTITNSSKPQEVIVLSSERDKNDGMASSAVRAASLERDGSAVIESSLLHEKQAKMPRMSDFITKEEYRVVSISYWCLL